MPQSVPSLSRVWLFCDPMDCSMPGFSVYHQLSELAQIHVNPVTDAIQPFHPLSSLSPPIFNLSQHQDLFQRVSSLHHMAKVLEFQLQHHSFQWIFKTDFFGIDWFDLFAIQGIIRSVLQHHSSKASPVLWYSAFFMVQISHPYMTTGKTIALTRWTFVSKVMSLLFNMLSRLAIAFSSKEQASFNVMAAVTICSDFGAQQNKICYFSVVSPSICHELMGPDAMIFIFWMLSFKTAFSFSSFRFIKTLFSSSLFAISVLSSAYLRLLIFLPAILIPACASSSSAFCMIYSAYKLNKQSDNIHLWFTPFPSWNQSVFPHPVLTFASWPEYRFLRRQVRWSVVIILHTTNLKTCSLIRGWIDNSLLTQRTAL